MPSELEHLSVTAASSRGIARLVADAATGSEVVVTRHQQPVAAVVGIERLTALEQLRDDLRDLALVVARAADDDGRRTSLDEAVESFGRGPGRADTDPDS
jgi:antitoxin (DNA-binding transcriptional repressor) of toxin-antitoxin stability system